MEKININSNNFYILSGLSASGKSTFTKKLIDQGLPPESIVSTDSLREAILGSYQTLDEFGIRRSLFGWEMNSKEIFELAHQILDLRLSQGLPVIFDAVNASEEDRKKYVDLAHKHFKQPVIVIFDQPLDLIKERLSKRDERFDFKVVENQNKVFKRTSEFEHIIIKDNYEINLHPNLLSEKKSFLIGDVHGLLDELVELLKEQNWSFNGEYFIDDLKQNRKLVFLGDVVDRGDKSIELLKAIYSTAKNGNATLLLGNHENKLISSWLEYQKSGRLIHKSLSASETILKFLKLEPQEQQDIINFLQSCNTSLNIWIDNNGDLTNQSNDVKQKISLCHANNFYYNEYKMPNSFAMYGSVNKQPDNDTLYDENYENGVNNSILIHGHVMQINENKYVYSLDKDQAFEGHLTSMDLESYINKLKENNWIPEHKFFEDATMKKKTEFNFDEKIKDKTWLLKEMTRLVNQGLATDGWKKDENGDKKPHPDGFKIYKYSKQVHFKKLWKTEKLLEKARGLTLDIAGNIVVHPFDKLYNFGEYDTGAQLPKTTKIQAIEKLNGFLGCISKHPFKNELLISTTGSIGLDAPFVKMINDFITDDLRANLLKFFEKHNETLMFEVLHPEDPHIIKYDPKDHGLWLIGAREKSFDSKIVTETELDKYGKELNLPRPKWTEAEFGQLLDILQKSELEGYMVRLAEDHTPLMKIKTNYYLVTKFVGRMGKNMVEMMYKKPEQFKKDKVDEEFYPVVDKIINKISKDDFMNMPQDERVVFVRDVVNEIREEFLQNKAKSLSLSK